jgi:hypothetical protein
VKPLSINLFPLSFEGEGDKEGEVSKHSLLRYLKSKYLTSYTLMRVFKNVVAQLIGQMRLMNQATTEI